jgi:hypothetical protein
MHNKVHLQTTRHKNSKENKEKGVEKNTSLDFKELASLHEHNINYCRSQLISSSFFYFCHKNSG